MLVTSVPLRVQCWFEFVSFLCLPYTSLDFNLAHKVIAHHFYYPLSSGNCCWSVLQILSMSKIVVRNNAPGWPAMVKTAPKAGGIKPEIDAKKLEMIRNMRNVCTATNIPPRPIENSSTDSACIASGMWLKRRYKNDETLKPLEPKKAPLFAPKIVRQCNCCQMLYTNYHMCQSEENESSAYSRKEFSSQHDVS